MSVVWEFRSCCRIKLWKKIFEGTAEQTKKSKEVIEAYLGVDE